MNKKLSGLPAKIEKNILRAMVRAGAQVVRKAAVENLDGGQNSDIIIKQSRRKSRGKIVFEVGPPRAKWFLKFTETGTLPHVVEIKNKKVLVSPNSSGAGPAIPEFFGVEVSHPGTDKRPFLRPALDESVAEIIEAMAKTGAKRVEKEAAK